MTIVETEKFYICNCAEECLHAECPHNQIHKKDDTCNWDDGPPYSCLRGRSLGAICCVSCLPREIKTMTIAEAEKEVDELHKQISIIHEEHYGFGGYAYHCGCIKSKPLREQLWRLLSAITKAKDTTQIEI